MTDALYRELLADFLIEAQERCDRFEETILHALEESGPARAAAFNAAKRELHTLKGHSDFVLSIAFSPNGKLLATGGRDSVITLWEVNSRRELISRNA